MRINTNMSALNAWRSLTSNEMNLQKSLEKLSSGFRINRAADDAAGLAVSEKMRSQIRGLNQAARNAQDGIGLVQTAEGGAGQIQGMLQRMRELTVQANSGTLQDADRAQLNTEFQSLKAEVDRTAGSVTYNNVKLLAGSATGTSNSIISSNPGVATFTATAAATPGSNLIVNVTQLADNARASTSSSFTAGNGGTAATSGYVLKVGATTVYQAAAGAVVDKSQIAAAINSNATLNTTLSAAYNATTGALTIQSISTGSAQSFTLTETFGDGTTGLAAGTGLFAAGAGVTKTGVNASYTVNGGAAVTPASNTNAAIATGITANLQAVGTTTITVNAATGSATTGTVSMNLQVGANDGDNLGLSINAMGQSALGISSLDISTLANIGSGSTGVLQTLDTAISNVSTYRAGLGATQNRLENVVGSLTIQSENITAAESRIRDVDMAAEMATYTKYQVLQQASTSMLAQANQSSQGVLALLRG